MGRALDVLGVYILPLCCIALDYAFLNLWWTELYPLTLLAFAASGMIAFAWAGRSTSGLKATGIGAGALFTGGYGAGLIPPPSHDLPHPDCIVRKFVRDLYNVFAHRDAEVLVLLFVDHF